MVLVSRANTHTHTHYHTLALSHTNTYLRFYHTLTPALSSKHARGLITHTFTPHPLSHSPFWHLEAQTKIPARYEHMLGVTSQNTSTLPIIHAAISPVISEKALIFAPEIDCSCHRCRTDSRTPRAQSPREQTRRYYRCPTTLSTRLRPWSCRSRHGRAPSSKWAG